MVTKAITATTIGINAYKIEVEVDVINSLPNISIVGLPDSAVSEARERVHSAIKNSGFSFPLGRVIVNLAPADIRKEGTNFDLPIAIGILKEQGVNIPDDEKTAFLGELSLDGSLRRINGVLPLVSGLKEQGIASVFVPFENAKEAALVQGIKVYGAKHLGDVVAHFSDNPIIALPKPFSFLCIPNVVRFPNGFPSAYAIRNQAYALPTCRFFSTQRFFFPQRYALLQTDNKACRLLNGFDFPCVQRVSL